MARYADVGKNRPAGPSVPTLEEIRRDHPDFTLITNPELQPIVLLDKNGVLLSGIVPGPGDSDSEKVSWDGGMLDLADFIEELREGEQVRWLGGEQDHRRGKYPFVSWGSVHGNGRLGPGLLKVRHPAVAYSLRNHNMVQRVAGHQDAVFQFYAL
ncbi:uncharacterized protein STEHIDRAFT_159207 [Stereum hirsutum FP-91666 SS1]|uniref:uncharacterized protein n=1 Tax=Stereum hirsutum (strain FP-91666) TaxID=721885 RepID=UPI000444A037|nr:uncharacterized protein STEHIDRAFT_159207 [Stereum hirsutum FP-91666 SS1]EIM84539.1 hypothetical protein STEHIDRAFT_159207 [Stereum hirsutum FP-91666 SS1]